MSNLRTLTLILAFLLGGCTFVSYAPGRTADDVPAKLATVRLDGVTPLNPFLGGVDTDPSENTREVLVLVRRLLVDGFLSNGITVVDGDNPPAPISLRILVSYQPERWPLINRNVQIRTVFYDGDGKLLFAAARGAGSADVFQSMIQSRDEMVGGTMERLIRDTVAELQKGTKHVVLTVGAARSPDPMLNSQRSNPETAAAAPAAVTPQPAIAETSIAGAPVEPKVAAISPAPTATAPIVAPHERFGGRWLAAALPGAIGVSQSGAYSCSGYNLELDVTGDKLDATVPAGRGSAHVVATVSPDGSFTSTSGPYGVSVKGRFRGDDVDVTLSSGVCPRTPGKGHRVSAVSMAADAPATTPAAASIPGQSAPATAARQGYDGRWQVSGSQGSIGVSLVLNPCGGYNVEIDVTGNKLDAVVPTGRTTAHVVATVSPDGTFTSSTGLYGVSLKGKFRGDDVDVVLSSGMCPRIPGKGHRIS